MQSTHRVRCSVLRPYAVHYFVLGFFFGGLFFLRGFGRHFEVFFVSSDSRIVRESSPVPRLAQPGRKPSHLGCPRVPASRQAGSPWMETFPSRSCSSTASQARQEQLGSAALPGQPFFLDYVVYASCSSISSGP